MARKQTDSADATATTSTTEGAKAVVPQPTVEQPMALSEFQKAIGQAAEPAGKRAPVTRGNGVLVRATRVGFHGGARRRVGDVFRINADEKLASWMEPAATTDE